MIASDKLIYFIFYILKINYIYLLIKSLLLVVVVACIVNEKNMILKKDHIDIDR
jgi:hypothetical protein